MRSFPSCSSSRAFALAAAVAFPLSTWWAVAQARGGLVERADRAALRAEWTARQIGAFMPARGRFTFPAPYNTEGIRLTNATDCGGTDCVQPLGAPPGRHINNHRGRDTALIFLGLRGLGPTLFSYAKATGQVRNLGPLFDAASPFAEQSGEGWYFSATRPTKLYVVAAASSRLLRYDVQARTFETVFDAATEFGADRYVSETSSSDDDNVHAATLRDASTDAKLGCLAYREDAREFSYYPARDAFGECRIDRSGRWLRIREDVDGVPGRDNLIVDLENGTETPLPRADGAAGPADDGYGYVVAADRGRSRPGAVRVWSFDQGLRPGPAVYGAAEGVEYITHANAQPGAPLSRQYACAATGTRARAPRASEIVCFRLDGSPDVLVVTQTMAGLRAGGDAGSPPRVPAGSLDATGGYFIWTSHLGGDRADAIMVKVPAELLTGLRPDADAATDPADTVTTLDTIPPSLSLTAPANGAVVRGIVAVTAIASDNLGAPAVTFKRDRDTLGRVAAPPYSISWNTAGVVNGRHTLTATARDAAGNRATARVTVTVANDATPPSVSITAPAAGSTVSGTVTVTAGASDNVGVAGVQFKLDGAALGAEDTAAPYSLSWNSTAAANGSHTLTATARDAAGNATTSAGVGVTVANGTVVTLTPQDTFIGLDSLNNSANPQLNTYTWPANRVANAILMRFNLSAIPSGAVATDATLFLALVTSDAAPETTYTVTANKVIGRNPVISGATGYTADGLTPWTPNPCCSNDVPLAQADVSAAYDTRAIDKAPGFKSWTITAMVQEWLQDPATNFGLLLNSDASKLADRYRFFASMEHADPALRPYLRVAYSVVPDVTPPVISSVLSSAVTSSGATVTWTTNEASDSQVEYGTTTSYGALTTLNANRVTAHVAAIGGLAASTTYHYRVRSRDAAGNLAVSGDFTFATLAADLTPPAVSISAPAAGATVTGTTTVAASASDNVGVVGVQFKLDGGNLGAEDVASPYSLSWNTAGVANGSHTLKAVARDAAGNQTTSAGVTVTVSNTAGGIAALYPGDVGIEANPDVIFVERFDEATLASLFTRWGDILNGAVMLWSPDVPPGSPVSHSLNIPWVGGGVNNGGHLYKQLNPAVTDTLYVRFYIKYPTSGNYHHTGIWVGGYNPPSGWPQGGAGSKPVGDDRFSAAAEQNNVEHSFDHYDYWMDMHPDGGGTYWGNFLLNNPSVQARLGQWTCVEQMVKLNNPTTASNGEHAIWLDGVKVSHLGPGFPNGTWSGGIFTQNPGGTPFPGFRWRSDASLNLNWIWLQNYSPDDPAGFAAPMLFAHVVAAKSYIGCLVP